MLEKLAVVTPRPRINLLVYHGAFAPRGRCHSGPVAVEGASSRAPVPADVLACPDGGGRFACSLRSRTGRWWARFALLQADLDAAHARAEQKAAAHRTFTPEELADRFPLFAGLTPEQREVLVLHFKPQTAQPGERIIRAGDQADGVYFISQGEVEVAVSGRRIKLGAGDVFGEMALISGQPRSADITALDYSKFAVLSQRDFHQFLRKYPEIRAQIASLAAQRAAANREPAGDGGAPAPPPLTG